MTSNVFSVPIFFLLFRETTEAAIIISVLLSLVDCMSADIKASTAGINEEDGAQAQTDEKRIRRMRKRARWQVWTGALTGLAIALVIGATFIAIWYTVASDLWSQSEELWEGIFSVIASLLISVMALAMLKVNRLREKWRLKLEHAFAGDDPETEGYAGDSTWRDRLRARWTAIRSFRLKRDGPKLTAKQKTAKRQRFALFILPMITVLREGLEAVVFVGGVSLGETATAIPLAAICGILAGFLVGFLIYRGGVSLRLHIFLVLSTCILLLVAAGLASKAVGSFETYRYITMVGSDVAEAGDGPGSYDVRGNVWHLACCNPNAKDGSQNGWNIFNAILGWTNNATQGSVITYCLYWLAVILALVYLRRKENRAASLARAESELSRASSGLEKESSEIGLPEAAGTDANEKAGHDGTMLSWELPLAKLDRD